MGARLGGVAAVLRVGDELTLEYKRRLGRFQVRWVNSKRLEVGVQNLDPRKFVFLELPEAPYVDDMDESRVRRKVVQPAATATPQPIASASSVDRQSAEAVKAAAVEAKARIPPAAAPPMPTAQLADLKDALRAIKEDTDGALQLVATTARELLSASGAAVAVAGGEDWICRASSGAAPRIGVRFQSPQGLTGQAAVSGHVVFCRDTEEDRRVNPAIWRSVQFRSVASVPIMDQTTAIGVLEVFAEHPNAFSEEQGPLLRGLGELLAELITASSTGGKRLP
jgi:GAF domain-containing protein